MYKEQRSLEHNNYKIVTKYIKKIIIILFLLNLCNSGISQYIQIQLILPKIDFRSNGKKRSFKEDLMKSMNLQMKFVMPIIIVVIAYYLPSAIALYWVTSNIFMIGQEILVRRRMEQNELKVESL